MKVNSVIDLLKHFKDEEECLRHLETIRWNNEPQCPHCKKTNPYKLKSGYKCSNSDCYKKFNVKTGTIFQNTRVPLNNWFVAMYMLISINKGINSVSLAKTIGVTQKTAWFMLQKIRVMIGNQDDLVLGLKNYVEVDELYFGGIDKFKHTKKRRTPKTDFNKEGKAYAKKSIIVGIIERKGNIVLKLVKDTTIPTLNEFITNHVVEGSSVFTDELRGYNGLKFFYDHRTVKHKEKNYVSGDVHTNSIENFWSILKTGIRATYNRPKDKYLKRYLDEFSEKFNTRTLKTIERMDLFLERSNIYMSHKSLIV